MYTQGRPKCGTLPASAPTATPARAAQGNTIRAYQRASLSNRVPPIRLPILVSSVTIPASTPTLATLVFVLVLVLVLVCVLLPLVNAT
jgi:hypothetical protein